jgi:hypothetical protein
MERLAGIPVEVLGVNEDPHPERTYAQLWSHGKESPANSPERMAGSIEVTT